jgi:hypothetical protein
MDSKLVAIPAAQRGSSGWTKKMPKRGHLRGKKENEGCLFVLFLVNG